MNCDIDTTVVTKNVTAYCSSNMCQGTPVSYSVSLNNCTWSCNPCDASQCSYQYIVVTGNVMKGTLYFDDSTCSGNDTNLPSTYSFRCDTCAPFGDNLAYSVRFSDAAACSLQQSFGGQVYCNDSSCKGTALTGTSMTNNCSLMCNPCNASQCAYQYYYISGTTLYQMVFLDTNSSCNGISYTLIKQDCDTCSDLGGLSRNLSCSTGSTDTGSGSGSTDTGSGSGSGSTDTGSGSGSTNTGSGTTNTTNTGSGSTNTGSGSTTDTGSGSMTTSGSGTTNTTTGNGGTNTTTNGGGSTTNTGSGTGTGSGAEKSVLFATLLSLMILIAF